MPEIAVGEATPESSPSLASFIGEMHGYPPVDEPETDAGAPPAESSETPSTEEAAPSETPETQAAPDAPIAASDTEEPTTQETDPLDGATDHLAYMVNGESRKLDGITVLKDGRAIVDNPDTLKRIERVLGERDHLFEQDQERHQRYQALEKLTEWRSKGPDGKEIVLTGQPAQEMREVGRALLVAEIQHLRSMFDKPPAAWVMLDADGNAVWNPDAMKDWNQGLTTAREIAFHREQSKFRQTFGQPAPPTVEPTVAPLTTEQLTELAPEAVALAASSLKLTTLSDESKATLAEIAPRYLRPASDAEVKAGTHKRGQTVVDESFLKVVEKIHAQQAKIAQVATKTATADRANTAKLAAAKVGQRPGTAPPKITPPKPPSREDTRSDAFDDWYERQQDSAAGLMRTSPT